MNLAAISIPYWGQCARREESCARLLISRLFHNNVGHVHIGCSFLGTATFSNTNCRSSEGTSLYNAGIMT